jgi:hypothetical protein
MARKMKNGPGRPIGQRGLIAIDRHPASHDID